MYIYFEAQTGRIWHDTPQAPSNFYRYTFDRWHLARVKGCITRATIGAAGLEYTVADLTWLDRNQIDRPGGLIPRPANPNN